MFPGSVVDVLAGKRGLLSGGALSAGLAGRWLWWGGQQGLFSQWRSGLLTCLPATLRRRLFPDQDRLVLAPAEREAAIRMERGADSEPLGACELADMSGLTAALSRFGRSSPGVWVRLPQSAVLLRRASFPAQVRNNLKQVLSYEMDRLTPFPADQVFFDYRLPRGGAGGAMLSVEVAVCLRERVTPWLQKLKELGLQPFVVSWDGAWKGANLLPVEQRPGTPWERRLATRLLALTVLLLTVAVLLSPLWQHARIAEELQQQIGDLRVRSNRVLAVRSELEQAQRIAEQVLTEERGYPRAIDLLRELAQLLPDNTWVQNLEYKNGEVQIRGESAQASALIGLLEAASGFDKVRFRSPVVQIPATGKERYHISLVYRRATRS